MSYRSSRSRPFPRLAAWLFLVATAGCGEPSGPGPALSIEELYPDGCDPIVDRSFCGYPFPNDTWTEPDASSRTGLRVHFHATMFRPIATQEVGSTFVDVPQDPTLFADFDGFSPGTRVLFQIPGATLTGTASVTDIARSVEPDSPIVVLEASTGRRIPHFVEVDPRAPDPSRTVLEVHPVVRLAPATRYIVAVRGLVDEAGLELVPTATFAALRDGTKLRSEPSVEARRARYADLFATLEQHDVARDDLQLAWDFTTASDEHITARLSRMISDGLAELGADAPAYTITGVTDDVDAYIARRIVGTVTVPMYLTDSGGPGATMLLDANGMPQRTGDVEVPFTVQIPRSAVGVGAANPKPILQLGHGIFGSRAQGDDSAYRSFVDEGGYVMLAMDWWGLSTPDFIATSRVASTGDTREFRTVPDRGQQAMLNAVFGLKMVMRGLATDPQTFIGGYPTIDPVAPRYLGASLGGVYGATLATVSPDVGRSVLLVPGQPFSLLLPRNEDAYPPLYLLLMNNSLFDTANIPLAMGLIQMLWDRVEPTGYGHMIHATPNTLLPFAHEHEVLVMDAIGDKSVSTLGAQIMARAMQLPLLAPAARPVYGLDEVVGPIDGSAFVEFDYGPPESTTQLPSETPGDPHDALMHGAGAAIPRAMAQAFLANGPVTNLCSGACDPY